MSSCAGRPVVKGNYCGISAVLNCFILNHHISDVLLPTIQALDAINIDVIYEFFIRNAQLEELLLFILYVVLVHRVAR